MSKIQDIVIPEGWKKIFLDNNIQILNGYAFSSKLFNDEGNGFPLIRIRDLQNSSISTFYSGKYPRDYIIKKGDLLIGMDGNFYTIKWNNINSLLNQRVCKVTSKGDILNQDFLFFHLKEEIKQIEEKTTGTTVLHLSSNDIKKISIIVPKSLKEQEKIAEILSTVDEVIENTDRLIEKYKKIKAGLMEDLFTRGIDIQTGKPHTKFKDSDLGRIPESWEVVKLGDILKVGSGSGLSKENMKLGKHLVYGGNGINGIHNAYTLKDEELIIGRVGEYCGNSVITKPFSWVTDNALIVRFIKKQNMVYWNYFLNYFNLNQFAYSAAQPVITGGIIYNILVKIPCFKEEEKIAEILTEANNKIKKEEAYKEKLEKIKKGLMNDLLTGKIRVKF